eukprot:Pgem_evm2s8588
MFQKEASIRLETPGRICYTTKMRKPHAVYDLKYTTESHYNRKKTLVSSSTLVPTSIGTIGDVNPETIEILGSSTFSNTDAEAVKE